MTTQKAARASPELRKAPLSPRYSRNYTTPRGTTRKSTNQVAKCVCGDFVQSANFRNSGKTICDYFNYG